MLCTLFENPENVLITFETNRNSLRPLSENFSINYLPFESINQMRQFLLTNRI